MLQQVCEYINNYFIPKDNGTPRVQQGDYTVSSGMISPIPALKDGQRFLIMGSALNDGVYTYHAAGITTDDDNDASWLADEPFTGYIYPMNVPRSVLEAIAEGKEWQEANRAAMNSPYTSENVSGVYSYTLSKEMEEAKQHPLGLPKYITSRFERWRKINFD